MNLKITFCVLFSFIISFSLLSVFMYYASDNSLNVPIEEAEFFSQLDLNKRKIFLLGSSNIRALNTTHIENYLQKNVENYEVYNLAEGGNIPNERLETLDLIISTKPDVVVYGLAPRDFVGSRSYGVNSDIMPLPNAQEFFDEVVWRMGLSNFNLIGNPKLTTVSISFKILNIFSRDSPQISADKLQPFPNVPFFTMPIEKPTTKSQQELKNDAEQTDFRVIDPPHRNVQYLALKEIITKLQKNNIKVILFTVPHHQTLRDSTPDSVQNSFFEIMDELSREYNLPVYQFYDKYSDLDIWGDTIHIIIDPESSIFSEEISQIILKEIHKNAL